MVETAPTVPGAVPLYGQGTDKALHETKQVTNETASARDRCPLKIESLL